MIVGLTPLRGVGYTRVSDEAGRAGQDNFHSPTEQRETVANSGVVTSGAVSIDRWVEAIDVSSKRGHNFQQPDFLAIVDAIKRGELDAVVVPRFDRFGRDLRECLVMIDVIEKAGGHVISASETTTDDAAGRLARNAFLMFANYQLDRITENWVSVMDRVHNKGIVHGKTPSGYVKGEDGRLVPHPEHGPTMTWAFQKAAEGTPILQLWRWAVQRGLPVKSHQAFRKMLRNRVYLGEVRCGKRPPVQAAHIPLTTPTIFAAAQRAKAQTWAPQDYLLTGLVRCGTCGTSMGYSLKSKPAVDVYQCQTRACPGPTAIAANRIEPWIEEAWRKHENDVTVTAARITPDLDALELDLLVAEDNLREWMADTDSQRANKALWAEERDRRAAVVNETEKALTEAHAKAGMSRHLPGNLSVFDLYEMGTNLEKRELLTASIKAIHVAKVGRGARVAPVDRCRIEFR